ncbi:60S ribosomal protein L18a-like protein isoform X1 [Dioscorea cayenensis subsp. rotundata]|uniref:60S ribosomal protein L18a-like protein isoform X1 n=1 Tax=Dioscorea cayennensis subsp. rotundata TaxID=55577 RepID=A0AB40CWT3_DIOCR|nr:60S ribosomal protein L18a-like protein isoform X1 [Dioscorea cayenensis subsp. rotundata]
MSDDEGKSRGLTGEYQHQHQHQHQHQQPQQYGTFQGGPGYSQPAIGFPRPVPPPGASAYPPPPPQHYPGPTYYSHGYQAIPGYAVAEGTPVRMARLPCCGIGIGWFLFIIGFCFAAIPWYIGAFILLCVRVDYREKPGYVACTIAAVLAAIAIILGVTKGADAW